MDLGVWGRAANSPASPQPHSQGEPCRAFETPGGVDFYAQARRIWRRATPRLRWGPSPAPEVFGRASGAHIWLSERHCGTPGSTFWSLRTPFSSFRKSFVVLSGGFGDRLCSRDRRFPDPMDRTEGSARISHSRGYHKNFAPLIVTQSSSPFPPSPTKTGF